MEIQLNDHFVLFASCKLNQNGPAGAYLKKHKGYVYPQEMKESEMKILKSFPCLYGSLQEGNTLQMYQKQFAYHAAIGKIIGEGPYGETNCFEIKNQVTAENCFLALIELEKDLRAKREDFQPSLRKTYRKEKMYYE